MKRKQMLLEDALKKALRNHLLTFDAVTKVDAIDITECRACDKATIKF